MQYMGFNYYINITESDQASDAVLQTFIDHHAPFLMYGE